MKIIAYTGGLGSPYDEYAEMVADRFRLLNDIETICLHPSFILSKCILPTRTRWIKSYLWDITPECVDMIIWLDSDLVPVSKISELILDFTNSKRSIGGTVNRDIVLTGEKSKRITGRIFPKFLHGGFFMAKRSTIGLFSEWKLLWESKLRYNSEADISDEVWLNYIIYRRNESDSVYSVPKKYHWWGNDVFRKRRWFDHSMVHFPADSKYLLPQCWGDIKC